MMEVTDFTKNGKCSGCGACCSTYLPITQKELKVLKAWVKKNRYKPSNIYAPTNMRGHTLDLTCPFLNKDTGKCDVYDIRPAICREFICNKDISKRYRNAFTVHNLRKDIFGDDNGLNAVQAELLIMNSQKG